MVKFKQFKIAILFSCFFLTACGTGKSSSNEEPTVTSNFSPVNKLEAAKINTQLGLAYLEKNDTQRAKQKLLLALEEAPDLPEAWYSMGFLLEKTGGKQEARPYYLKSVQLAPNRGDIQNNYGTYLCRSGEYQRSIQHFLLAVKEPSYLEVSGAYENAGLCALKIPDKKLAVAYFTKAIEHDPSRTTAANELIKLKHQS